MTTDSTASLSHVSDKLADLLSQMFFKIDKDNKKPQTLGFAVAFKNGETSWSRFEDDDPGSEHWKEIKLPVGPEITLVGLTFDSEQDQRIGPRRIRLHEYEHDSRESVDAETASNALIDLSLGPYPTQMSEIRPCGEETEANPFYEPVVRLLNIIQGRSDDPPDSLPVYTVRDKEHEYLTFIAIQDNGEIRSALQVLPGTD